ncbi:MAG TPA: PAS domain-containing protein, partial [Flavobacterium sp.]|nr:PAS domain-containing protein [Flavobacterium sp.]
SNLVTLLPKSLAIAYNTVSRQALTEGKKVGVKGVLVKQGGKTLAVNLSVTPVSYDNDKKKGLVVIFNETGTAHALQEDYPLFEESTYNDSYTKNLEKELSQSKSNLIAAYEKLDAINENMQSYNEELISANEEMQSTNEEMQSVNEELHTINADYQVKNKELQEVNDDLNNYFRSNVNGQLFVNNDLQLMKYSPGAVKLINLLETDIGRPLSNISTNIRLESIETDVRQVLKSGEVFTKEIETTGHAWYQIMIMPYIQSDDKKNGAIITFNDITELKKIQFELDERNRSLSRINADLDHFILAASHDLLAPLGNIETSINMVTQMDVEDTEVIDFLNIIDVSIKKFRALITDIALIAKVESEMMLTEVINMEELIDNVEWSLKDKINLSATVIKKNLQISTVIFSRKNMRSILYNLISNAIKFKSERAPAITISTYLEDGYCVLAVQDNGRGIPSSGLEKIFNLYGRINQNIEGSGIGLYLTKKIINAAGGYILVDSELGIGTKFTIFIKENKTGILPNIK